jgi:hypothetical protein
MAEAMAILYAAATATRRAPGGRDVAAQAGSGLEMC